MLKRWPVFGHTPSIPVFGKGPPQQGDVTGYLGDLGFDNSNVYKI